MENNVLERGLRSLLSLAILAIGAKNNSRYMFLAVLEWITKKLPDNK